MSEVTLVFGGAECELDQTTGLASAVTAYAARIDVVPPIPAELLSTVLEIEKPDDVQLDHTMTREGYKTCLEAQLGKQSAPKAQLVLSAIAKRIEEIHTEDRNWSWGHVSTSHGGSNTAISGVRRIESPTYPLFLLDK